MNGSDKREETDSEERRGRWGFPYSVSGLGFDPQSASLVRHSPIVSSSSSSSFVFLNSFLLPQNSINNFNSLIPHKKINVFVSVSCVQMACGSGQNSGMGRSCLRRQRSYWPLHSGTLSFKTIMLRIIITHLIHV